VIPPGYAEAVLQTMRAHPAGEHSARIGQVGGSPAGTVILKTGFGGERIVDMLVGEQLPRIC
jgi:hydrogenase expression/formation protein HypE